MNYNLLNNLMSTYEEQIDQLLDLFVETYFETFVTFGSVSYQKYPNYLSHLPNDEKERNQKFKDILLEKIKEKLQNADRNND